MKKGSRDGGKRRMRWGDEAAGDGWGISIYSQERNRVREKEWKRRRRGREERGIFYKH